MATTATLANSFNAFDTLRVDDEVYRIARLDALEAAGLTTLQRLPVSIRVLLESLLRREDGRIVTKSDVEALAAWSPAAKSNREIPYLPGRVVLQDFTGVPVLVDLAAMRDAAVALGGDPAKVNPVIPVDLVIDHSVQVDFFGDEAAFHRNVAREYERNRERYAFLRWGQNAIDNYRAVPPGTGIIHQVNLEYLASVVRTIATDQGTWACPDTLVGTDSHTVMINGIGVVGWGVGGIEAEAAMLGQPISLSIPEVVGVRLSGALPEGATATDAVLGVVELLRRVGVVEKFVEFYGPGLSTLSLADRATIANMAPEYGATMGFFPVDSETLRYMRLSGRDERQIALVEAYCKVQGLFRTSETPDPEFSQTVHFDLSSVAPCLAGPKLPNQRVPLSEMAPKFREALANERGKTGFGLEGEELTRTATYRKNGTLANLGHGAVALAAITSCTNTSNPSVLLAAGLLAKKAVERGLRVPPWVKTSLAPGSRVVMDYLEAAGLLPSLEALGFNLVGFGCTTCIGNSGPLPPEMLETVQNGELIVAGV
ncbi:MAG: aconitate hydratase AcnA, partial [Planctomycetota bacterium]